MVELIGVLTLVAMHWVLAAGMANESESDRRRRAMFRDLGRPSDASLRMGTRDAA